MPRDRALEELMHDELGRLSGLTEKAMFGGLAYLLHGNLLCGARVGSLMLRLGKGNDAWALEQEGVTSMVMQGRNMPGWIRCTPEAYSEDKLRKKLVGLAVKFVKSLPAK